jgi:S1-C subfamily serine protease
MANKITVGLLLFLLVLAGGFGYYAFTSHQQINLMREELSAFQNEQATRTEAIRDEITSLNSELRAGLDNLETKINENNSQIAELQEKLEDNMALTDTLQEQVGTSSDRIDSLEQELAEAAAVTRAGMDAPEVYRRVNQSVVRISNGQRTVGSGFIYDSEGDVLTAHHVIEDMEEIYVIASDGKVFPAGLIGSSVFSDVAVLKLDGTPDVEPAVISDSSEIQIGDPVAAIGSPFDLADSMNTGIVSQVNRFAEIAYDTQSRWVANLIQFDAAVNFGNSGGPLFNASGGVIGLVIARVGPGEGEGIYYAVSANKMKRVADSIIAQGHFDYPWLGVNISDLTPQQVQEMGMESINGVLVNQAVLGGPAEIAGIQDDDIIVAIDDTEIRDVAMLTSYLGENKNPGDIILLTVIRGAATLDVSVEVGQRE